ncbi:MAG: hypothetical protein Q4D62_13250 [Planctomycetia bacterium]|nr:hypothetical protein [Planctomycetia bacterium]
MRWSNVIGILFLSLLSESLSAVEFTFKKEMVFIGHRDAVNAIDVWKNKREGRIVSGSDDRRVVIWNLETGKILHAVTPPAGRSNEAKKIKNVFFVKKEKLVLVASLWKHLWIWKPDTNTRKILFEGESTRKSWVSSDIMDVAISPNGKLIAFLNPPYALKVCAFPSFKVLVNFHIDHHARLNTLCFSQDSKFVMMGGTENKLQVYSLLEDDLIFDKQNGHAPVTAIVSTSDTIIVGDQLGTVRVWDIATGDIKRTLETGSPVRSLAVVTEDAFVSGHDNGEIHLWEISSETCLAKEIAHNGTVRCIHFYEEKKFLTGGTDKKIIQWELSEIP